MAIIPRFTSRVSAPGPIPGAIEAAQATGRGIQQIGRELSGLGEVLYRRQKALNEEKNRTELAKFDADLQAKRTELLRSGSARYRRGRTRLLPCNMPVLTCRRETSR